MHHALKIHEILSNIFDHLGFPECPPFERTYHDKNVIQPELAALARTCRAFKEPALSVLWRALMNLSPLVRCLPEASHLVCSGSSMYGFSRQLTQTEWAILQGYTRRIRYIQDFHIGLDRASIKILSTPPTAGPLFPNLRTLHCRYSQNTLTLLHLPLPSLIHLNVDFCNPHLFQDSSQSFPKFSPNIARLRIRVPRFTATFSKFQPNYLCRWKNLCTLDCREVSLDMDALSHLSHMPSLTRLDTALNIILPSSDSPIVFLNLQYLTLRSEFLEPISRFLFQTQMPIIINFTTFIYRSPSRQELTSFLAGVPICNASHTIQTLLLNQSFHCGSNFPRSKAHSLSLEDLQPCMVLHDLHELELSFSFNIDLTEIQVLSLASAWPKLKFLSINAEWGWNTTGGITPGGLIQLLQTCRSLGHVALRLDTRGYTEVAPSQVPANVGLTISPHLSIDSLDCAIDAGSVPALAMFFQGIATCVGPNFSFYNWGGVPMMEFQHADEYVELWDEVRCWVYDVLNRSCKSSDSETQDISVNKGMIGEGQNDDNRTVQKGDP